MEIGQDRSFLMDCQPLNEKSQDEESYLSVFQSKEGTWRESVFGQWYFAINRCRDLLSWGEGPINHLSHTKHESGSNIFLW